jgi:hypothetical protein
MAEILRIVLLLALAGSLITAAAIWHGWWSDETRRLSRVIRKVLGEPDAQIVAAGQNAAAAFRQETEQVLVLRDGGARALLYPTSALLGAELIVDDAVVARVHRGEPRRAMDVVRPAERCVILRLLFDDARNPDFELSLAQGAVGEARTWLARAEAITRRPGQPAAVSTRAPAPAPEPNDEEDDEPPF